MTAIAITTTSCNSCGRRVGDAMHLMLCDGCLDKRIAQREPVTARAAWAAISAALDRRVRIAA